MPWVRPGTLYRRATKHPPRAFDRGRLVLARCNRGHATLEYTSPDHETPEACLRRQAWLLDTAARGGGARVTVREARCMGLGAPACEYTVAWIEPPRAPLVVGLATIVVAVLGMLGVPILACAALVVGCITVGLVELRATRRARRTAAMESGAAFRWFVAHAARPEEPVAVSEVVSAPDDPSTPALEPTGDYWRISYGGTTVLVRHSRGLVLLAHLVRSPGADIHVRDLDAITPAGGSPIARDAPTPDGNVLPALGDAGELLDARARAQYRARLHDLRAAFDEAEACHDLGRTAAIRAEIDALAEQLQGAGGMGGRSRRAAAGVERLRVSITRRLRAAIASIAKHHPRLGKHFDASVSTGYYCSYTPVASSDSSRETSGARR